MPRELVVLDGRVSAADDIERACLGLRLLFSHHNVGVVVIEVVV